MWRISALTSYRILGANPRMQHIIGPGYTPGMVWRPNSVRVFDSEGNQLSATETPLGRCIRTGETAEGEDLVVYRADGACVPVRLTVAPVHLDNGTQWGAVVVAHDLEGFRGEPQNLTPVSQTLTPTAIDPSAWLSRYTREDVHTPGFIFERGE